MPRRRSAPLVVAYILFALAVVGTVIWAAYRYRDLLTGMIADAEPDAARSRSRAAAPDDALGRLARDFTESSEATTGDDSAIFAVAGELLQRFQQANESYAEAARAVAAAGWGDAGRLDTPDAIDARIRMISGLRDRNADLTAALSELPGQFRSQLRARGVPEVKIDLAEARHFPASKQKLALAIRENDEQVCKVWIELLDLHKDRWGKWHLPPDSDRARFDDPEAQKAYADGLERIAALSQEQADLQNELRGN